MALKKWNYQDFEIEESLKLRTDKFQYFFRIKEANKKRCTYCIWITDEVINTKSDKASTHEKFEDVINSDREQWVDCVKNKIDQGVVKDLVLKISASGETEINLSEIDEKVEF